MNDSKAYKNIEKWNLKKKTIVDDMISGVLSNKKNLWIFIKNVLHLQKNIYKEFTVYTYIVYTDIPISKYCLLLKEL